MMVLNLVLHEAQMTFTKFQWSINFCIFFSHISAGCQLIEKINVDSKPLISGVDMIAKSSLYNYFHFWVSHMLLHTGLKLPHFLEWMSTDFQIVWWLFSNLGKPRFDITYIICGGALSSRVDVYFMHSAYYSISSRC